MQRLYVMTVFLALLAFALPALAADAKFPLTGENTKIEFVGTKADGKHEGGFKTVTGNATSPMAKSRSPSKSTWIRSTPTPTS